MSAKYIPRKTAGFRNWLANFASRLSADPTRYGVTPADAARIQSDYAEFNDAYQLAINSVTRTRVTVAALDSSMAAIMQEVRALAQFIRNNNGVADADKVALGLHLRNPGRTPVPPPSTSPLLSVIGATPGSHTMRFADQNTPDSRKRPFGAIGLLLFRAVDTAPTSDPQAARFDGLFTRNPFATVFDSADSGKKCTYWARWTNGKGQQGPWSAPVTFTVP